MSLRPDKSFKRTFLTVLVLTLPLAASALTGGMENAFAPDRIASYVIAALLIGVFVLIYFNFICHFREEDAKKMAASQNARLGLALQTGNLQLWIYSVAERRYIQVSTDGETGMNLNPVDFADLFDRDTFEQMRRSIFDICEGKVLTAKVDLNGAKQADGSCRNYEVSLSVADHDSKGNVADILCIQRDVTEEKQRKLKVSQLLMRYHTVFNSSLLDMIYYDKDGVLHDINEKACQQFGVKDRQLVVNGQFLLKNNPFFSNVELENLENTRTTTKVNFGDYTDEIYHINDFGLHGTMYYESTINPIRNAQGELEGIFMAGRNVTEMVESFHRLQEGIKKLRQVTKEVSNYIENINYALKVSNVRLVNYYPHSFTLELSDNIKETQLRLSQLRCIRLGSPRFRRHISSALNRMDHLTQYPVELNMETEIRDKQHRPIWLQFNLVPMIDKQGTVERYFGMCRETTQIVETERKLAIETKKAQETELLKQAFLTNMSYEIRTPLNTVVGFAELFETEHDAADESLFVEEIRRNSNQLLKLVNDILYLSRLDANMEEYNKQETDFSILFDCMCQLGWSTVKPEVKTVIENPYERLMVEIDAEHLGKVIEKICQTAVNKLEKGFIRAKYEYRHGELTINIENSGWGVDAQTLPHIFERFVRNEDGELVGTGLDLPILQTLVLQMGGNIEIQSEKDKGTTTWITIPCKATVIEKRREI